MCADTCISFAQFYLIHFFSRLSNWLKQFKDFLSQMYISHSEQECLWIIFLSWKKNCWKVSFECLYLDFDILKRVPVDCLYLRCLRISFNGLWWLKYLYNSFTLPSTYWRKCLWRIGQTCSIGMQVHHIIRNQNSIWRQH